MPYRTDDTPAARPAAKAPAQAANRSTSTQQPRQQSKAAPKSAAKPVAKPVTMAAAKAATPKPAAGGSGRSRSRGGRGARGPKGVQESALTSMPTGRLAYADTRTWLVKQHGLICAYCAKKVPAKDLTLDHVAPRRGMTAYDRRDNLVLCCLACNIAKADKTTMAWLLGRRSRAVNLIRFGSHLSQLLVEMAHDLAGPEGIALAERLSDPDYPYAD